MIRKGRLWSTGIAALSVIQLTACLTSEPTTACESLDVQRSATTSVAVSANSSVLAIYDYQDHIVVLRDCAPAHLCFDEAGEPIELEALQFALPTDGHAPDEMLITGSGHWLVYRADDTFVRVPLDEPYVDGVQLGKSIAQSVPNARLIGALRQGDWVLYRDHAAQAIRAYRADDLDDESQRSVKVASADETVVALGDRNIVMRDVLQDNRERLSLVRVDPQAPGQESGQRIELIEGPAFEYVLFTRTDRGDGPVDEFVVASSGEGDDAVIAIFDVDTGEEVDRFPGALVPGRNGENVDGISAVAPDSSHLAYATPNGSLALRDLQANASCRVRSANQANHRVAGFAADGTLYFEAEELDTKGNTHVFTYDPGSRELSTLTSGSRTFRLQAAPTQRFTGDSEFDAAHGAAWAVVSEQGQPYAVAGNTLSSLHYGEMAFLPRHEQRGLWVLAADGADKDEILQTGAPAPTGAISVRLKRVMPVADADDTSLEFDTEDSAPLVLTDEQPFVATYTSAHKMCIATSRATPWSTDCAMTTDIDQREGVFGALFTDGDDGGDDPSESGPFP